MVSLFITFLKFKFVSIVFWLPWVFVAVHRLSLSLRQVGAALLLWSTARFSTPDHQEEEPLLTATGESPHAAMKTRAVANKPVERQRWGWSVKPTWIAGSNRKLADV